MEPDTEISGKVSKIRSHLAYLGNEKLVLFFCKFEPSTEKCDNDNDKISHYHGYQSQFSRSYRISHLSRGFNADSSSS